MSKWLTVNEALDLILKPSSDEKESISLEQEEAPHDKVGRSSCSKTAVGSLYTSLGQFTGE